MRCGQNQFAVYISLFPIKLMSIPVLIQDTFLRTVSMILIPGTKYAYGDVVMMWRQILRFHLLPGH